MRGLGTPPPRIDPMIDRATGTLIFDRPSLEIHPDLTRTAFLASPAFEHAMHWIINEPHHSWRLLDPCIADGVPLNVVLFFHGEQLTMVELADADPKFGTSWNDWSRDKELARHQAHDDWLTLCLGTQRKFPWGTIWSGYDDRAAGSSIIIRYEAAY
jgi:hypothetical protein